MFLKNIFRIFISCCVVNELKSDSKVLTLFFIVTFCILHTYISSEFIETYSFMEKDQSYHTKRNSNCLDVVKSYCHFIHRNDAFSTYMFKKQKYSYHV